MMKKNKQTKKKNRKMLENYQNINLIILPNFLKSKN